MASLFQPVAYQHGHNCEKSKNRQGAHWIISRFPLLLRTPRGVQEPPGTTFDRAFINHRRHASRLVAHCFYPVFATARLDIR